MECQFTEFYSFIYNYIDFLFACLNLGILVSTISDTQQVAFQISTMVSLLPSFILSGFIYPIESMPAAIQIITNITPVKFYIIILRDILLKGVGMEAFWAQVIYLIIFSLVFLTLSTIINKKKQPQPSRLTMNKTKSNLEGSNGYRK